MEQVNYAQYEARQTMPHRQRGQPIVGKAERLCMEPGSSM